MQLLLGPWREGPVLVSLTNIWWEPVQDCSYQTREPKGHEKWVWWNPLGGKAWHQNGGPSLIFAKGPPLFLYRTLLLLSPLVKRQSDSHHWGVTAIGPHWLDIGGVSWWYTINFWTETTPFKGHHINAPILRTIFILRNWNVLSHSNRRTTIWGTEGEGGGCKYFLISLQPIGCQSLNGVSLPSVWSSLCNTVAVYCNAHRGLWRRETSWSPEITQQKGVCLFKTRTKD